MAALSIDGATDLHLDKGVGSGDIHSEFGCVRFHQSAFGRFATDAGNQGCMSANGAIKDNAFEASERTARWYIESVLEEHGGKMPAVFYVLARQLAQLALLHALYVSAGRQVFQFTSAILEEFRRTDLSETPVGKLTLPYSAGFLHFGRQPSLLLDDQWRIEAEYVDGAYFHCGPEGQLTIQLTLSRPSERWSRLPGPSFSIPSADLALPAHHVVDRALDSDMADAELVRVKSAVHDAVQEWDASTRPVVHAALSLVLNALFFLDGYGADTDPVVPATAPLALRESYETAVKRGTAKAIRNARNSLMADGFSVVRLCGTSFDSLPDTDPAMTGGTVRTHWRRGHWRMQPCGPQLSQIKRVWVRPALVGKDAGGQIKGHQYVVGHAVK